MAVPSIKKTKFQIRENSGKNRKNKEDFDLPQIGGRGGEGIAETVQQRRQRRCKVHGGEEECTLYGEEISICPLGRGGEKEKEKVEGVSACIGKRRNWFSLLSLLPSGKVVP